MFSFHVYACTFDSAAVKARALLIQHISVDYPSPVRHMLGLYTNLMLSLIHSVLSAFNVLPFPQIW